MFPLQDEIGPNHGMVPNGPGTGTLRPHQSIIEQYEHSYFTVSMEKNAHAMDGPLAGSGSIPLTRLAGLVAMVQIERPVEEIWFHWTHPDSIRSWNIPYDDWHCPFAELDLRQGGKFNFRMERIDGSEGFDHMGTYGPIVPLESIQALGADGRWATVEFLKIGALVQVRESYLPDPELDLGLQQEFTDNVLQRFKAFVEAQ